MESLDLPAASGASPELRFTLLVRPESAERPWHAELQDEVGERHHFTTPLDLIRHLAQLGGPPSRDGGLR